MTKKLSDAEKLARKTARNTASKKIKIPKKPSGGFPEDGGTGGGPSFIPEIPTIAKKSKAKSVRTTPTTEELVEGFANGDPTVVEQVQAEQAADNAVAKTPATNGKPKTLAEAFPIDLMPKGHKYTLQATGDPTTTEEIPDPVPPVKDPKAVKAAKKLRKQQRKGDLLWVTEATKNIVSLTWMQPEGGIYQRWLVKFDDKTELVTQYLAIVYSREHADHHIKVGSHCHRDMVNNKEYAAVLQAARDDAAKRAKYYGGALKNLMSSDSVQEEIESHLTKKAEKEDPLTIEQLELARKIADLAIRVETSPASFVMLPIKLEKLGKRPEIHDLSKYGIDEALVTIQVLQKANQIHRGLEPRIDGVPLSQLNRDGKATAPKVEVTEDGTVVKGVKPAKIAKEKKPPKEKKAPTAIDSLGSRVDSQAAVINAAVLKMGAKPMIVEELMKKTGFGRTRVAWHFCVLIERGFMKRKGDKYTLTTKKGKK